MFGWLRDRLLRVLRVPPEPNDPLGSEGTLLVFRAAEGYYRARIVLWWVARLFWLVAAGYVAFILVTIASAVAASFAPASEVARKKGLWSNVDPDVLSTIVGAVAAVVVALYLVQSVVSWALLRLDYEMRWYKVTDRSLRIREGIWFVREMTMSFANVQNVSVQQGPLQKLFGVADLIVQSAGGGGSAEQGGAAASHAARFRGIAEAEKVKSLILERLRRHRDAGLGDDDDRAEASVVDVLREVRDEARALRSAVEA